MVGKQQRSHQPFLLTYKHTNRQIHKMDIQHIGRQLSRLTSTSIFCGPHNVPHQTATVFCPNFISNERSTTNILHRLKNSRWKHCHCFCQCYQQLYPPPKRHYHLTWPFSRGPCFYAGEINICPCFSIKFPDLRHLIDMLKSRKDRLPDSRKYHDYPMFHNLRLSDVRDHMVHYCAFTQHPLVNIQIMTILWINEPTQTLRVLTCFAIRGSKFILSQILANPKALAHRDIAKWLRKIFDEAGSTFSGWQKNGYFLVSSNRPEMPKGHGPNLLEISISRNLGDGQWPDKQWKANAHS